MVNNHFLRYCMHKLARPGSFCTYAPVICARNCTRKRNFVFYSSAYAPGYAPYIYIYICKKLTFYLNFLGVCAKVCVSIKSKIPKTCYGRPIKVSNNEVFRGVHMFFVVGLIRLINLYSRHQNRSQK